METVRNILQSVIIWIGDHQIMVSTLLIVIIPGSLRWLLIFVIWLHF